MQVIHDWGFIKPILLNPFPNDKILDWSKLKAFTDDKLWTEYWLSHGWNHGPVLKSAMLPTELVGSATSSKVAI